MIYSDWAELWLTACVNHPRADGYTALAYLSLTRCGRERRSWPDVALHGEISEKWTVDVGPHLRLGLSRWNETQADGTGNASTLQWRTAQTEGVCANQRKQRCLGWNAPTDREMGETLRCCRQCSSIRILNKDCYDKLCGLGLTTVTFAVYFLY